MTVILSRSFTGDFPPVIDNSFNLVRNELINEMNEGMDYIEANMTPKRGGVIGQFLNKIFQNPLTKQIYDIFLKDIREQTTKQIDVILKTAREYVGQNLEELIDENVNAFLKYDLTTKNCKKKHSNYERVIQKERNAFKTRINPTRLMLGAEGDTYDEVCKSAFGTKKIAMKSLFEQLRLAQEAINIVIEDLSILKIPVPGMKEPLVKIIKMGYNYALKRLKGRITEIFN